MCCSASAQLYATYESFGMVSQHCTGVRFNGLPTVATISKMSQRFIKLHELEIILSRTNRPLCFTHQLNQNIFKIFQLEIQHNNFIR